MGALVVQMERISRQQPALLIFEDIHWADPTSLELLELIIERSQSERQKEKIGGLVVQMQENQSATTRVTSLSISTGQSTSLELMEANH